MNKVYIVLVNYNTYQDTIECIESLLKSDFLDFQIFIIDNSLNDNSIQQLVSWASSNNYNSIETDFKRLVFPLAIKPLNFTVISKLEFDNTTYKFEDKILIIRAVNNGFAAANNIALNYILKHGENSDLVWLLNNDTVVEKFTLSKLVDFYNNNLHKKYILGSKLRYYYKPNIIQAIVGNYNIWLGKHVHIGNGEDDHGQYDNYRVEKNDYIVGASLFFPGFFIEQAGLMCEDYFLYFEELDWLQSGIKNDFSIAVVPDALVYHKEGSSIVGDKNNDTSTAEYYSITNRVRFIKKWYPYSLPTVVLGVFWALLKRILNGRFSLVKKISATVFHILLISK